MKDLIQNYNLKQLIQEDTHFTENSSSLLDLILVRNSSNILTSGVVDSFIPDQIRFSLNNIYFITQYICIHKVTV